MVKKKFKIYLYIIIMRNMSIKKIKYYFIKNLIKFLSTSIILYI